MKLHIKQVQRKRLAEEIADQIVSLIVKGSVKQGDRLPAERELMKRFNVGRGSLRQAIGTLSMVGVLNARAGSGTYITVTREELLSNSLSWGTQIKRHRIRELLEVRHVLEKAIVELATERASATDIDEMRDCLTRAKANRGNLQKVIDADMSFHAALAKASHNTLLFSFFLQIRNLMRSSGEQVLSVPSVCDSIVDGHTKILNGIEARDANTALKALAQHFDLVERTLASTALEKKTPDTNL